MKAPLTWPNSSAEQLLRQRGAIDGDERPLVARAFQVDRPSDNFLAGAAFAFDEHGHPLLATSIKRATASMPSLVPMSGFGAERFADGAAIRCFP